MAWNFVNDFVTTLKHPLTDSAGTIYPNGTTGAPGVAGTVPLRIDSEILYATNTSGTAWPVERGKENTAAAAHSSGGTVTAVLTAAALTANFPVIQDFAFTPTLRQNGSTVTATVTLARAIVLNKIATIWVHLAVTGTGSAGTQIDVVLPAELTAVSTVTSDFPGGAMQALDLGTAAYRGQVMFETTTRLRFHIFSTSAILGVNPNYALASGDNIKFTVTYPLA